jgi:hypothetical protein
MHSATATTGAGLRKWALVETGPFHFARTGAPRTARSLDLLAWTQRYRAFLKPEMPLDFARHPFLEGIYRCTAQRLVVYKASQMGASEYAVSYALHAADMLAATVLYVFPTDTHVSDFSSARIGPAIEASPYLAGIVVDARGVDGKRGADRVTLKRVRNRFLYLRGAQISPTGMAPQLKSIDADVLILDEVDEMDPRAPSIAVKRLGHSRLAQERRISTPTYTNQGIHAAWQESDQRAWHVRCTHCSERQPLSIQNVVLEWDALGRPVRWHGGPAEAWAACRQCERALERLGPGEWVATYPERAIAGFHLTKLFSPTAQVRDLVEALATTDETKRREAYNQDLGEPYTPKGGQLTAEVLDACRREYAHGPLAGVKAVAGVDVGRVLHVVVRAPADARGELRQIWAGLVDTWDELGRLLVRCNVGRTVIDALPETTKAREFQATLPKGQVWLAYYVNQALGTKKSEPATWDDANGVVNLDRTRTLDLTYSRFSDGSNTLPADARDLRDYYSHLQAPVRVIEAGPGGVQVAAYVEASADHLAHAENYCTVASLAHEQRAGVWGRR